MEKGRLKPSCAFASRDASLPEAIDYASHYCALDLPPGASLREIEDRGRLLCAAFQPDGLPPGLRAQAAQRSNRIRRAVEELRAYWRTCGAAPSCQADAIAPHGQSGLALGAADRLLDALAQAMAANVAAAPAGHENLPPAGTAKSVAAAPGTRLPGAASPAKTVDPPMSEPRRRQAYPNARSLLVRLAVVGLVLAFAFAVRHYRADRAAAHGLAGVHTAQPGLLATAPPPTGAAAPPPVRNPYSDDNSNFFRR